MARATLAAEVAASLPAPKPDVTAEQVSVKRDGDVTEARSTSRRIRTVEDLLAHIEADLERFEVAASEATKWEVATVDASGEPTVTELHRVFVRLRPKAGPTTREVVESMIAAARRDIRRQIAKPKRTKATDLWQVVIVADTHFGKYAWGGTTGGGNYDLEIARGLVDRAAGELLAVGDAIKPARRTIAFLGDLFHYDNPRGQTTSGTQLERDGRIQKMIEAGCDSLLGIVEKSATTAPTDVVVVNGNHDETLTWTFQRILQERFRGSAVKVKPDFTGRQYLAHGGTLLGFAHGNRAKRRLPQVMAIEAAAQWAKCQHREWHTGHYHSQAAEWSRPIETIDGVLVRVAPAICPPDDWHAENGFIGSRQAMETFFYAKAGGLTSMHVSGVGP